MREQEFTRWMQETRDARGSTTPNNASIARYIGELGHVETAHNSDLDQICRDQGGLTTLWNLYKYSKQDARNAWDRMAAGNRGNPNPTPMDIHPAQLLADLRKYRSRINQYKKFCIARPPANMPRRG